MSEWLFTQDQASSAQIEQHLQACDASFVPPLSRRVALDAYAVKLAQHAVRFEAWRGDTLAALVAAYCNDPERDAAFVTSVSVLPAWRGQALAKQLMQRCVAHAEALGFARVQLETDNDNQAALTLYRALGFTIKQVSGDTTVMSLANERKQQ